jgi:N-acyl-D-aspartate/D-glutamate deacylase
MNADMVIRSGTLLDGTGGEPFEADVVIHAKRIVSVEKHSRTRGHEEIDARGHLVTPGFVDIHTHYDGQVTWENRLSPSSSHGVTTVVMGNCGVGFAPCRPSDRNSLVRLMEGVEDLPGVVLAAGLPWSWESFPQYLDVLAARRFDIDVATQVPHAALRLFVMGERATDREIATTEDRAKIADLARLAVEAGALGFGTSRTLNHRASDGRLISTINAAEEELTEVALALRSIDRGVLQLVSDFSLLPEELARLQRIVERSNRPLSLSLLMTNHEPEKWQTVMEWVEHCNIKGLAVRAQVCARPTGLLLAFDFSRNPFYNTPTYKTLKNLAREERLGALRQPAVRARLITEIPEKDEAIGAHLARHWDGMYVLGEPPCYEPEPNTSIAAQAARRGMKPEEVAFEALLEQEGRGVLWVPVANFIGGNLDRTREMLRHPHALFGLGDGGAHLGFLCDASLPTYLLQYWGRDRPRGRIPLPEIVRGLSRTTACAVGLNDRGLLKPGFRADVNVIDFGRLELGPPRAANDLPAGGTRITQDAKGYLATLVAGTVAYRDGWATGALPGRLVRGPQAADGICNA